MRILHIISAIDPSHGGTAAAVVGMAQAQARVGLNVTILSTHREAPGHETAADLRSRGVEVTLLPGKGQLSRHPQLASITESHVRNADVVHVHAMWEEIQYQAAKLSRRLGKPYIIAPHGMLSEWSLNQSSAWKKKLYLALRMRRHVEAARAINYTSDGEADETAWLKLSPPKLVEPLGIDLSEFETLPPRDAFLQRYPQLRGKRIISFLGRIHAGKGVEYLVPALAELKRPDVMLLVIGPDWENYKATIDSLMREHGVSDRVVFTGMLRGADRVAALACSDLFAIPSEHENFGVAVAEALACSVPVVVSDKVNIHPEISAAKVGGVVPLSIPRIAAELARWLDDDALRSAAAERARPFVFERYDWDRIARSWARHYSELAAQDAPVGLARPVAN